MSNPEVLDTVRRIALDLAELRKMSVDQVADERAREKAFDALYDELKQYKDDFIFQSEKPLLLDLLLFYDSLNWFQESLIKGEMSADTIVDSYQYLIDEFVELLYRRDVIPMERSEVFDRKHHKAVKVVATQDPEEDQHVYQVLKRGFTRGDKLLRPEEVVIRRYRAK